MPAAPVAVSAPLPAWSALPPLEEDTAVPVLEAVVARDEERAALEEPRGLDRFLVGLSDEETAALAETLEKGGAL